MKHIKCQPAKNECVHHSRRPIINHQTTDNLHLQMPNFQLNLQKMDNFIEKSDVIFLEIPEKPEAIAIDNSLKIPIK